MKYFLKSLLPLHWIRNHSTDEEWDALILSFLENPVFSEPEYKGLGYVLKLNGVEIWVENYPYAFGSPADTSGTSYAKLPSRRTVIKLKEALDNYRMQEIEKGLGK